MSSACLIGLLRSPPLVSRLAEADWNKVIEQGRKTQLLGQLTTSLQRAQVWNKVPAAVQRHLLLAQLTLRRRSESALWEVATLRRAVDPAVPIVLLKGCAYLACADANAAGRSFSDMDVMVRRQALPGVEADLMAVGWKPGRVNAYDHAYYRNWMHEVPPMAHVRRHTVVDLHHAINPPVSRFYMDPDKLFAQVVEVDRGVFVLGATDRVIHCAMHLLQEGEPKKLIRDLYDLHLLVRQHHGCAASREQLGHRAEELQVARLVEVAIGAAAGLFGLERGQGARLSWLQVCLERAARESNASRPTLLGNVAGTALLAYAHWLKMPIHLLLPHLAHKSWMRMTADKDLALGVI